MVLPANVNIVTLTGTYLDWDGTPASGSLTFIPSISTLRDPASDIVIKISQQRVELTSTGVLSISLISTDDADLIPSGWHYDVVERIDGYAQRLWILQLPSTLSTIDVSDIPSLVDPSLPFYPTPIFAVTSVVGQIGDVTGAEILADATVSAFLATKASDADLDTLTEVVATKASDADLDTLTEVVATKASDADLDTLTEVVATKADTASVVPYTGATTDLNLGAHSLRGENVNVNEGTLTDPTVTDLGGLQVHVTSVDCLIRSDTVYGDDGWLYRATVPESTLTVTNNTVNHLYVTWNSGSPIYAVTTDRSILNLSNTLPVARIYVTSGAVHSQLAFGFMGRSAAIRWLLRSVRITDPVGGAHESGLSLSETATRVVNISAGSAWFVLSRLTFSAIAQGGVGVTSYLLHHTSGNWVQTPITQYNNTQYDDGTDLTTLGNTRYAVNWIYRSLAKSEIIIVLGTDDYSASEATSSTIPPTPQYIDEFYYLCGRIIVQKNATTAYLIENATTTHFETGVVLDHNDLDGIQGGTSGEYYHLTAAELATLSTGYVPYTGATTDLNLGAHSLHANNVPFTEGTITDPTITDAAGSTISITSCEAMIRSDTEWGGDEKLYRKTIPANTNLAVTDNAVNYIYITWNSGTPIYAATTNRYLINASDKLPVARVSMVSGSIEHQINHSFISRGSASRNYIRIMLMRGVGGIERETGLSISESGTRVVTIAAGYAWIGLKRITLAEITNGVDGATLKMWHHTGGTWAETTLTGYNNTQYDNGTNLATLTSNRYAVNWIYRNITTNEIDIVLGRGDYTLAQAEASTSPTIPDVMTAFYVLCGRIIVQKNSATAYAIESATTSVFNQAAVSVHNDLSGIQGGTTSEYYHLTNAQVAALGTATSVASGTPTGGGAGTAGQILYDASYLYVCTATNTWKRVALSSF